MSPTFMRFLNMPLGEIQMHGYGGWFDDEMREHVTAGGVRLEFSAQTPAPRKSGNADRARRGPRST